MIYGARYCLCRTLCVVAGFCLITSVTTAISGNPCSADGIVHATLSTNCSVPGESCDFTCDYGFERNPEVDTLTCTWRTGTWNHHLSSLCRARDGFIVVREYSASNTDRDIYIIPLYDPDNIEAIKVVDLPDDADAGGVIYDGYRRSILWAQGGVINMVSVDDGSVSILIDLSSGYFALDNVVDLALDTATGDIYFVGNRPVLLGSPAKKGLLGVIDTDGTATELYYVGTHTFTDIALDPVNRWGEYVIWANGNGNRFYKLVYYHNDNESFFFDPLVTIKDVKFVGDFLYYIDSSTTTIKKVNSTATSDVTTIQPTPGLLNMAYLDVPTWYGASLATPSSSSTTLTTASLLATKDPETTTTPNNKQKGTSIISKPPPNISSPVTLSTELITEKSTTSTKNTALNTMKNENGDTTILADTMTPVITDTTASKTISTTSALNTNISTTSTKSVIIPTASQQCVCTGDTFIEEPAILVAIGFIAGVMVTLFCVLLVTWIKGCKTRQENVRVAVSEAASRMTDA